MNKAESAFREYLAKAKELSVQSIAKTGDKELKALLALAACHLNNKAYEKLKSDTKEKMNEFDEKTLDKFGRKEELVDAYKRLEDKYNELQEKSEEKSVPAEIFEALRKAYIANEESKDILAPAESRVLAAINNDTIVFNNWDGELLLSSLRPKSNDLKLPALNEKKNINLSNDTVIWASAFAESNDRLFCGTRDGRIIYWEKNNWGKSKLVVKQEHPAPILSMVYSKNKEWLFYSVKNTIYRHDLINKPDIAAKKGNKDNFIRAINLIEDDEDSFLIYADSKAVNNTANIYCQRFSGDIKGKERIIGSLNSGGGYALAYHHARKLLALGNEKGNIYISKIDCKTLKSSRTNTKIKFHPVEKNHRGMVKALAFSPDGRFLASGSTDGTIMLWNLKEKSDAAIPQQYHVLTIDSKLKILSVVFDPKGEFLIFNDEQYLRFCPPSPEIFYNELCRRKKRDLTDLEWKQYIGKIKREDICSSQKKK